MKPTVAVVDQGKMLEFSYEDCMRYHGPIFPGGVAHGFVAMSVAFPLLSSDGPLERREIHLATAFPGPGARDAVELVTRAVREDRYRIDPSLEQPERGLTLARYLFRFTYRDKSVALQIREGFVVDEFISLSRSTHRTDQQEQRLTVLKQEMADRLLAKPPQEVYEPTVNSSLPSALHR